MRKSVCLTLPLSYSEMFFFFISSVLAVASLCVSRIYPFFFLQLIYLLVYLLLFSNYSLALVIVWRAPSMWLVWWCSFSRLVIGLSFSPSLISLNATMFITVIVWNCRLFSYCRQLSTGLADIPFMCVFLSDSRGGEKEKDDFINHSDTLPWFLVRPFSLLFLLRLSSRDLFLYPFLFLFLRFLTLAHFQINFFFIVALVVFIFIFYVFSSFEAWDRQTLDTHLVFLIRWFHFDANQDSLGLFPIWPMSERKS